MKRIGRSVVGFRGWLVEIVRCCCIIPQCQFPKVCVKGRQTYALARSPRYSSQIPHPIELYLGYDTHYLPRNSFQSSEAHSFEVGAMLLGPARIESVEHQYPVALRRCCFPEAARHNVASVYTQRSESHSTYRQQRDSCCARWYDFCFSRVVHRQVILWCSD